VSTHVQDLGDGSVLLTALGHFVGKLVSRDFRIPRWQVDFIEAVTVRLQILFVTVKVSLDLLATVVNAPPLAGVRRHKGLVL
jgi:hypothetical protein